MFQSERHHTKVVHKSRKIGRWCKYFRFNFMYIVFHEFWCYFFEWIHVNFVVILEWVHVNFVVILECVHVNFVVIFRVGSC